MVILLIQREGVSRQDKLEEQAPREINQEGRPSKDGGTAFSKAVSQSTRWNESSSEMKNANTSIDIKEGPECIMHSLVTL